MTRDDLKARTVRGMGWSAVQSWGNQLISFAVYPVLARLLGPENYGLIAMAGVYISVLEIFLDVSFGAAIEQRKDLEPQHLDSIFWAFLVLGVVLTGASMIAAPWIAGFFHEPALPPIIRWLSLGFLLMMVSGVQTSLLRRELHIKALASRALISAFVGSSAGIVAAFAGLGVWSLVIQRLTTRVLSVVVIWRLSTWRPRLVFSRRHFAEVAGYGTSVMGYRVLHYVRGRLDQLLIGHHFGAVPLGLYFNATTLATLASNALFGSYIQVSLPALAKLQDDTERFQAAFHKICRFVSLIAFPAFAGLSLLAKELTVVVLGQKWQASAPVLQVLALAGIAQSIQFVSSAAMLARGHVNIRLVLMVINTVLSVAGFLIAYRHGIVAVAAAFTVCAAAMTPVDLLVNRRLQALTFRGLLKAIWAQTLATMVMMCAIWYVRHQWLADLETEARLVASIITGVVVYGGAVVALDRGLWSESRELLGLILPSRRRR